jgi:DNA-binding IclR family transcriptional regulator
MESHNTAVPSLDKAIRICDYLAAAGRASFSEIQLTLQLPKSTTHWLLAAMVEHGFLHQDHDARYCLGLHLYELGNKAIVGFDVKREAMPFLYDLRSKARLTCHLGILDDREAIYLVKVESLQSVIVKSWEGRRLPLHSTGLGKSLIAWKSDGEIDQLFPEEELPVYTANTLATRTALKRHLQDVRTRGWSLDDGEDSQGVRCVAAPVRTARDEVLAAISVSGTDFQIPDSRVEELSILVKACCIAMSEMFASRR